MPGVYAYLIWDPFIANDHDHLENMKRLASVVIFVEKESKQLPLLICITASSKILSPNNTHCKRDENGKSYSWYFL